MTKYDYYWKSDKKWYHRKENGVCVINDDAPEKAKRSYNNYMAQRKRKTENALN